MANLEETFIVSEVRLEPGEGIDIVAEKSPHPQCERCWNLRADVGKNPKHPSLCGRCASVLG